MSLVVKRTSVLLDPSLYKMKVLLYGFSGIGKSTWLGTVPNIGIAACETGHGSGQLSNARADVLFCEPASYAEFDAVCSGAAPVEFKPLTALGIDSLSDMNKTFIKDYALSFPRSKGDSDKRRNGIPELDDYGTMAELTRRLLRKAIGLGKHVIATATLRIDKPDPDSGQGEMLIGPDLPGQMFLGSTAMFDLVLCLRTRQKLRDPKDAKSKYTERYFVTQATSGLIAKSRLCDGPGFPLLDEEEIFDPATGRGTFSYMLDKIQKRLAEAHAKAK
jgi:hypothetical protein